jgi:hypothetical protein
MLKRGVLEWHKRFSERRKHAYHDSRYGYRKTAKTCERVEKVRENCSYSSIIGCNYCRTGDGYRQWSSDGATLISLTQKQIILIEHRPYSPELASCHFFPFPLKNAAVRDTFSIDGGGPAAYIRRTKSGIRRCFPETLPYVAQNRFLYGCQNKVPWSEQQLTHKLLTYEVILGTS